jgi:hypothetical protein
VLVSTQPGPKADLRGGTDYRLNEVASGLSIAHRPTLSVLTASKRMAAASRREEISGSMRLNRRAQTLIAIT